MSVKSTVELTKDEAVKQIVDLILTARESTLTRQIATISNEDLENLLERLADEAAGGESFNNYMIIESANDAG